MPEVVTSGQLAAEARMLDTFAISVPTGGYVYDPAANDGTGGDVREIALLFTTKGRVKVSGGLGVSDSEAGDRTITTVSRELHIPAVSPVVPRQAVAVCTSVDQSSDPTLLGASLTIIGPAPGSQTTARRMTVEQELS